MRQRAGVLVRHVGVALAGKLGVFATRSRCTRAFATQTLRRGGRRGLHTRERLPRHWRRGGCPVVRGWRNNVKLSLTRSHAADADTLRRRVEAMQSRLQTRYGARTEWESASTLSIGAPGVRGRLALGHEDVHVDLELSPVLLPLRRRIEKEVGRELDRVACPEEQASSP